MERTRVRCSIAMPLSRDARIPLNLLSGREALTRTRPQALRGDGGRRTQDRVARYVWRVPSVFALAGTRARYDVDGDAQSDSLRFWVEEGHW